MSTIDTYAARIARKLSQPMRDALLSYEPRLGLNARVGTIVALIDRGLVRAGRVNHLTDLGKRVLAQLTDPAIEPEETGQNPGLESTRPRVLAEIALRGEATSRVLNGLREHGSWDRYTRDYIWVSYGVTLRAADSLVNQGLATVDEHGIYRPVDPEAPKPVRRPTLAPPAPKPERLQEVKPDRDTVISYRIQSRPNGAEYWYAWGGNIDYSNRDDALRQAKILRREYPNREFRVIEVRTTWTVVE